MKSACLLLLATVLVWSGCTSTRQEYSARPSYITQTHETQSAVTPPQALEMLKQGNERFASGHSLHRNLREQVKRTSAHQYPYAAVVSCIDSRAPAELIFDQGIGDIFNARIAGNIINDDILGSLEYSTKVAGAKLILVVGHTGCGAVGAACDGTKMGHITELLAHIQPAVEAVKTPPGEDRSSKNQSFVDKVAEDNVVVSMETIRSRSSILNDLINRGDVALVGAMYDVKTGRVRFLVSPSAAR
ncbi:carbonic anhydrase family protein [Pedosphaera parvula]|uniref:carbonic anhydrase n=1 Tax=Pedosphaera parvula (strain Ellin514) TaxID=320771 RepID=B9XH46_PEDPL|nr:carbonic anhydrase family protein [Pedosphaera parvula]EEF60967.1 carbonic anhydrase [Pedosphaera parvula Ellin514]